jgi:bifunctional NMN adenylyltransferase/nudix hydrolase
MYTYDHCVFIGRFSIFHQAHYSIIKEALRISKDVIVVIGSSGCARSTRNPWTSQERQEMISGCFEPEDLNRIKFIHMKDYLYNDNTWISILQEKIRNITDDNENTALIGYESDETSFYLKLFPQFKFVPFKTHFDLHASHIRDYYFSHDNAYKKLVPECVVTFLENFKSTKEFKAIKEEKDYIDQYKASWLGSPFPVIHMTVDCIVIKSGHVLLVERGRNYGIGLLAMPGGFVNPKETLVDAALRELKEETGIKINTPELKRAIVDRQVFDDPNRSARGRVLSTTFLIDLGAGALPKVAGGDDARAAHWYPLSDVYTMEDQFFEDHFHVVSHMVSKR